LNGFPRKDAARELRRRRAGFCKRCAMRVIACICETVQRFALRAAAERATGAHRRHRNEALRGKHRANSVRRTIAGLRSGD